MTDDSGVTALERAVAQARDYSPLPEFTDAACGMLAKIITGIVGGPISDQADALLMLSRMLRRDGK
jgi:predicted TIM-barrel enzyme